MTNRLMDGQYRIGDFVFGSNTNVRIVNFSKESDETQNMDLPVSRTDELRFGKDSITPTPITLEMLVLDNHNIITGEPIGIQAGEAQERLKYEWRNDGGRKVWNSQKPLYYCRRGIQKVVFGRPRKFTQGWDRKHDCLRIVADYQPVDVMSYGATEYGDTVLPTPVGELPGTIVRGDLIERGVRVPGGSCDGWCRFILNGPINKPVIELSTGQKITIDYNIPAGVVVEVSSYPWQRRVVTSTNLSLSARLIDNSPYLDEIRVPPNETVHFGLHGTGTTSETNIIGLWREAYTTV